MSANTRGRIIASNLRVEVALAVEARDGKAEGAASCSAVDAKIEPNPEVNNQIEEVGQGKEEFAYHDRNDEA
jgi:hypothetical protein